MMATYFNGGSEIQSDNLQTLFLMNRGGYAANFSDGAPQPPPGVLLLNHPATNNLPPGPTHHNHNHNHHHHLLGIPLAGEDPSAAGPRFHYNLWGGGGGEPHIPTAIAINGGELGPPMGFRRPAPVTTAVIDHQQLQHHHHQQQQQGGLSLSLNNSSPHKNVAGTMTILSPGSGTPTSTASAVTTGVAGCGSPGLIMRSKYLKAAQQLLDEVVNVGKAMDSRGKEKTAVGIGIGEGSSSGGGGSGGGGESGGAKGGAVELTTAQRQELQMKKAKLLNMLDEVEQRYRQYHSQMQMVAASFEQAAGGGSAKTYTALALQTISKQFRCLRDAIGEQIRAVGRSMGEEEEAEEEGKGRSRLRMVDHQLRQQRALQQLGMMHHNAWRPQRGLPERAVSVLRAWLFEHFLHPYPKDSDKHILAKQTGLTRSQVSNWFINARVRLWKPMVEEMYVEEMKSNEQNGSENNNIVHTSTTKDHNQDSTISSKSSTPRHSSRPAHHPIIEKPNHNYNQNPHHDLLPPPPPNDVTTNGPTLHSEGPLPSFSLVGPSEMDPMSPKRQRMMIPSDAISSPMDKEMKPVGRDLFPPDLGGFGSYPIGEIGSRYNPSHHPHHQLGHQHQYHHGNTVSLTLGLPHDSDQSLSLAGNHHHHHQQQQNFLHGHQAMHSTDAGGGYDFVT